MSKSFLEKHYSSDATGDDRYIILSRADLVAVHIDFAIDL